MDSAFRDADAYKALTEREKHDLNHMSDDSSHHPPSAKKARPAAGGAPLFANGRQSLLEIFTNKLEREHSKRHVPFHGLKNLGEKAKLYMSLEKLKEAEMAE